MIFIETQKDEFTRLGKVRIFDKGSKEDTFNRDLLVIGLGGTGRSVLSSLKGMLKDRITPEDNINFLLIDSDIKSMEETINDSKDGKGMNALEVLSIYRPNLDDIFEKGIGGKPVQDTIAKWMSNDFPHVHIGTEGANGNRQVGRLMFSNAYEDLRMILFEDIDDCYKKHNKLDVIVVSSTAGGTGSGILADLVYNVKAYAKSRKWDGFRIGGCLVTPDALFANREISENEELRTLLWANSHTTLLEMSRLMQAKFNSEMYTFESGEHRLQMCDNIFNACMLVSGKQDDQGYIPASIIYSDIAYFLKKLATNKYVDEASEGETRTLLRDSFFEESKLGYFKVVNDADYKIPIKEIENVCEYEIFEEAFKRLHNYPANHEDITKEIHSIFEELSTFMNGEPGDEVVLTGVNDLIKPLQYARPSYKEIKKKTDGLGKMLPKQLEILAAQTSVLAKSIRIKLSTALDDAIDNYLKKYGPFVTMQLIGAVGVGGCTSESGMVREVLKLESKLKAYQPNHDYEHLVESILAIVAKRFFAFPSAKRETENGYYEAAMKDALAKERNILMDALYKQDVFGDVLRQLRHRSEQLADIYEPFAKDLEEAIAELGHDGKRITGFLLKNAQRNEFLPSDYMSEERLRDMQNGLINLMMNHQSDLEKENIIPVSEEMERLYKNFLTGLGAFAPEKLLANAFAEIEPTLSNINMMFVSGDSEERKAVLNRAATAFVSGSMEKIEKKKLCKLKKDLGDSVIKKLYMSLPESLPNFSKSVATVLTQEPYNMGPDSIAFNPGSMVIATEQFVIGVKPSMLACADDMLAAYNVATEGDYKGIHCL